MYGRNKHNLFSNGERSKQQTNCWSAICEDLLLDNLFAYQL